MECIINGPTLVFGREKTNYEARLCGYKVKRKYALSDKSVPGYREALAAPCAVCQIEVDERLIRYAGLLRLLLEIGDCLLGELNRHLLLELLGIGVLLPFAEIVFFPHVPFLTFCNGSLRSLWLSWPK